MSRTAAWQALGITLLMAATARAVDGDSDAATRAENAATRAEAAAVRAEEAANRVVDAATRLEHLVERLSEAPPSGDTAARRADTAR